MAETFARHWWVLVMRGVAAILLIITIAVYVWPTLNTLVLALLFGAYAVLDGIFTVVAGFATRTDWGRWWVLILEGLAGIVIGVAMYLLALVAAFMLRYFVAVWAIVMGILNLIAAIQLRRVINGEWVLALAGIISLIFGLLLVVLPDPDPLTLTLLIGACVLVFGILMVVLAFRLRGLRLLGSQR